MGSAMADGPPLNALDRFRKRPGRLVLEAYSHCEVPAGCGGLVLRWRDPRAALPLNVYLYTPVQAACFLDGAELRAARVDLAIGHHTLAFALPDVDLSAALFMFAAVHTPRLPHGAPPPDVVEESIKILSQGDGTWKFTLAPPADDAWKTRPFEDADWPALAQVPAPELDHNRPFYWQYARCADLGASCLGLPEPPQDDEQEQPVSWWRRLLGRRNALAGEGTGGPIWIRKVFEIPAPQERPPQA
jgi:hypothetical protein